MTKTLSKLLTLLLSFFICVGGVFCVQTDYSYGASDNTTTLISYVKNSDKGEITFKIRAIAGYKTYYELVPAKAKTIHGSQSVLSVDFDRIKGVIDNRKGSKTITKTIKKNVRLYGDYVLRVGVRGYYNGSSILRQSKVVKSTMCESNRKITWKWTKTRDNNFDKKKTFELSQKTKETAKFVSEFSIFIKGGTVTGLVVSVGINFVMENLEKNERAAKMIKDLAIGEYLGFYLEENSANTKISVYFATFDKNKKVKSKMLVKTVRHSDYVPVF